MFVPSQSYPQGGSYLFVYSIRVTNEGSRTVQVRVGGRVGGHMLASRGERDMVRRGGRGCVVRHGGLQGEASVLGGPPPFPAYLWVHIARRPLPPSGARGGMPLGRKGSIIWPLKI